MGIGKYFRKILKYIYCVVFIIVLLSTGLIFRSKAVVVASAQSSGSHPFGLAGPSSPDDPNKIAQLGVRYAREGVDWYKIETTDNVYDFSFLDSGGWLEQLNLEPIARIGFGNDFSTTNRSWAVKCDPTLCPSGSIDCPMDRVDCPPKDLASNWDSINGYSPLLTDFVTRTLTEIHARGKTIEYFVVGNEVNSLSFWLGTGEDYLKTRATIYNAAKRFNAANGTSYKVVDNGIASTIWENAIAYEAYCRGDVSYAVDFANRAAVRLRATPYTADDFKWLNCSNIGGRDYKILKAIFQKDPNLNEPTFDIMAYHFYEPWDVQEEVINWARQEMINNEYAPRPVMNTEGGYRDLLHLYSDTPGLEQDVANEIPKLHAIAFNKDIKTWLWLPFTERGPEYTAYGYEWKGLVKDDQAYLKAFTSYKTMVAKMNGFSSIEKITGTGAGYVYKVNFSDKNPLYVVWDTSLKTVDLSSLISGNLILTKVDGTSQVTSSQSVSVSDSPVYIESLSAGVTVQKQVDKTSASTGAILTYVLTYSNPTTSTYSVVRIEDPIPAGTTFISATNGGTSDGTKVIWNIGNFAPGASGSVSFQTKISGGDSVKLIPTYTAFYLREPISFKVKNTGANPITLVDTMPWIVTNSIGNLIYDPGGNPTGDILNPGQELEWRWNQKDSNGAYVDYGTYNIKFMPTGDTNSVEIKNQHGSDGHFTFNMLPGGTDEFKVFMTKSNSIRLAIENYYDLNNAGIPIGPIIDDRPGKSPYDSRWSWHYDPSLLNMTEAAIELCDGNPSWVESNLDFWAGKTFCPWEAQIISLD